MTSESTRVEPTTGFGTVGTEPSNGQSDPNNGGGVNGGADDPANPGPGTGNPPENSGTDGPAINVGGARVNGKSNGSEWPNFRLYRDYAPVTLCKAFYVSATTTVPITIVDVTVSEPGVFALAQANSNADCGVYAGGILVQGDCRGFQIPPANAADQQSTSCGVTIRAMDTDRPRRDATLTFTLIAECSSTTGVPCDDPNIVAAAPSAAKPVRVTWKDHMTLTAWVYRCLKEEIVYDPQSEDEGKACPTAAAPTS